MMLIEPRQSTVHGTGAFATSDIAADILVAVYEGRRISARQASRRAGSAALTYLFGLSDGSYIDGTDGGNASRHINHSCLPNCTAYEVERPDGSLSIEIHTLRAIAAGEELFLDYRLEADGHPADAFACGCGARSCRGSLLALAG